MLASGVSVMALEARDPYHRVLESVVIRGYEAWCTNSDARFIIPQQLPQEDCRFHRVIRLPVGVAVNLLVETLVETPLPNGQDSRQIASLDSSDFLISVRVYPSARETA